MYVLGYLYYLNQTLTRRTPRLPVSNRPGLSARIGAAAGAGLAAWRRARTRRAVRRELSALSDHALKDIGLERRLIDEAAERITAKAERAGAIVRTADGAEMASGEAKGHAPAAGAVGCG